MKKIGIAAIVMLMLCLAVFGFMRWQLSAEKQRALDAKYFIEIYQYIIANEDKVFEYLAVAKEFNLSEEKLGAYLWALERAGKIKVTPHYIRKPVVITRSDRIWYYHRVTLPDTVVPEPPFEAPGTAPAPMAYMHVIGAGRVP